jgi:hypothetical protein
MVAGQTYNRLRPKENHNGKKLDDILREDREDISEVFEEKAKNVARKWFEYGEYLTVEIDTGLKTCTVCEV